MTSSVIKMGSSPTTARAVAFNFDDMTRQANEYIVEVRSEAAKIIASAQAEAEVVRSGAEAEGRQAALDAAESVLDEKVGRKMATLLPALRQAVDSLQRARQEWLAHWEHAAIGLATAIASRIVRREVQQTSDVSLALIREALELSVGSSKITIRLNPNDHANLAGQVETLCAEFSRLASADVIADESISPGGCRGETEFGVIDQQIETQLDRIEQELTNS